MKHTHKFLTVFLTLALLLSAMPAGSARAAADDVAFGWAKGMGGTDTDISLAIALDSAGNVYTAGFFKGTVDFDPGAGTTNLTSAGEEDIFISKLNKHGNFVWARSFGSTGYDTAADIVVDSAGNVYTTGSFKGIVDFNPGAGTFNLTSEGSADIFVSKLNSSGNFVWARRIGGTGYESTTAMALDSAGNILTTGSFQGTVDFDPGAGTADLTSAGGDEIFVSKLDSSGNYVWAAAMGGIKHEGGTDIAVDSTGNVYTTGYFFGTVDFDPGSGTTNLTSVGGSIDIFVSKLNSSGNYVWAKTMGGTNQDRGYAIAVDSTGDVYTSGEFQDTADFDPGAGATNLTSAGQEDIFVSKLDSSGNFVWAKGMGGTNNDRAQAMELDSAGNIYTSGFFSGTVDFDPGTGTANRTSAGGSADIFVSKLNSSGNYVWAKSMGGTDTDGGYAIALDSAGNVYTSGYFQGTADFDPGTGTANLTSAGGSVDIFVSKLVNKKSLILRSQAKYDGWVLESTETSGKGGTKNNRSKVFMVGDDASNRQYRGILSFDTSGLPDNAVITSVTLKVKHAGLVGTNPYKSHKGLYVDIQNPYFGSRSTLQLSDFQKGASLNMVGKFPKKPVSKWYVTVLSSAAYPYINLTGVTQFRLRYKKDDNNDFGADYLKLYSGNAPTDSRPQLIVEYYVQ